MSLEKLIALTNLLSVSISIPLIIKREKTSYFPGRLRFFLFLIILTIFRSFFVAFWKETDENFDIFSSTGKLTLFCKFKAFLTISSQISRLLGIPLFLSISFFIVILNYKEERLQKLCNYYTFFLLSTNCIIFLILLLTKKISIYSFFHPICYLDIKTSKFFASLFKYSTLICFIFTFFFLYVLKNKKRNMESSGKFRPLIKASIFYSLVPVLSFIVYEMPSFIKRILPFQIPSEIQRLSSTLLVIIFFFFERKISLKHFWNWKRILEIEPARSEFGIWLKKKGKRKESVLLEEYERIFKERIENMNIIGEIVSDGKEGFERKNNEEGFLRNGKGEKEIEEIEKDLMVSSNEFLESDLFRKFAENFENVGMMESCLS